MASAGDRQNQRLGAVMMAVSSPSGRRSRRHLLGLLGVFDPDRELRGGAERQARLQLTSMAISFSVRL